MVPQAEKDSLDHPERSREATLANNCTLIMVDRAGGPYRVLYVGGRPHWEYKFLRRAVDEDQQVQLVSLVRIARREPKFDFRSRTGEATNPLFRGFGNQNDEAAETYDKPVLVRQGTEDAANARRFSENSRGSVSISRHRPRRFGSQSSTPDQMLLVQKFVSQRGGGMLMLGGQDLVRQRQVRSHAAGRTAAGIPRSTPEVHASQGHRMARARGMVAALGASAFDGA